MHYSLSAHPLTSARRPRCIALCAMLFVPVQAAARSVKEQMDRKFGPSWHCIIGEGFGFQCTYQLRHMIFIYYQGNVAILLFKC